jgi:topoisomerase IV subunit B
MWIQFFAMATKKTDQYSESSIKVLKGLEPVKQRPGMYTRTDNPLHMIQEVIDNASDEALGGHGHHIVVTMHTDGSVSVEDDGRGIPVGMHPEEKRPVVELVFTQLHAGGKFEKGSGGAYAFSGGLHGVGVSVTNALSKRMEVTVWRDKQISTLAFEAGFVVEPLKTKIAPMGDRPNGTRVRAWPDGKYFDSAQIPMAELQRLLRSKAVLLPGVKVTLIQEKGGEPQTWLYTQGLKGYLDEAMAQSGHSPVVIPAFDGEHFADPNRAGEDSFAEGEGASWVVAWTEEGAPVRESYVNLIPTPAGGTHESGLRDGLFNAVKSFIDIHALQPKGVKLMPEDVFARASFVLSAKVLDPQFQGQIKERLNSRDAVRLVSGFVKSALDLWLNQHVDYGKKLAELVIKQAQARTRAGQKVEKKKSSGVAVLPGKLTDCESEDIAMNEIFLVEGDSAGGSAKMGRNKEYQAILPLRGKVLNTWEAERDRLFANNEVHDIAVAIGVDPHGSNDEPDMSNLRYGKICILSDADVDGAHIQVLLLTLFYKHFPKLMERGHVYIARPPLFRVDAPARGKKPAQKLYALDEGELKAIEDKLRKEGLREGSWQISRFKGLG